MILVSSSLGSGEYKLVVSLFVSGGDTFLFVDVLDVVSSVLFKFVEVVESSDVLWFPDLICDSLLILQTLSLS